AVHHPRPRRGDRAGRPGRGHDGRTRDSEGRLRHRPATTTRRGPGHPLHAAVSRAAPADLAFPARGGRARLRAYRLDRPGRGMTAATGTLTKGNAMRSASEAAADVETRRRRRPSRRRVQVNATRLALLVLVLGGWQLLTAMKVVDPFF